MTRICWFLLPGVFVLMSCNSDRVAALEKRNKELTVKLESLEAHANQESQRVTLDLQEKCAKQAEAAYKTSGFQKETFAGYTNHYSAKLNKCFVQFSRLHSDGDKPTFYMTVMNAFEGTNIAEYYWINSSGKKYWEVEPFVCKVLMPNGEERHCQSQEEFTALLKQYMEE